MDHIFPIKLLAPSNILPKNPFFSHSLLRSPISTFSNSLPCSPGTKIIGARSLLEMVSHLKKPRRVMMLVKAGKAVDSFIDMLLPLLDAGDIIIDGGERGMGQKKILKPIKEVLQLN